eukprot:GFUD01011685.1.p1 GENE.GFUD01011685.1~~GFUD01011685.1.p1  ORF type:complete len:399 (-),score=114.20 GFUD01011685.1:58-1197(-)
MESESEVPCYLCGEEVVEGDDYRIHVSLAHGVDYDIDRILDATGGDGDEATGDKVTLSEDSEMHEDVTNDKYEVIGQLENTHIGSKNQNKGGQGSEMNAKSFFSFFDDKLKQIKDLAEGKIEPISVEDGSIEVVDDNQIWQMFENIKKKVMTMEIPEEIFSSNSPQIEETSTDMSQADDLEPIKSQVKKHEPIVSDVKKPQPIRQTIEKPQPVRSQVEKPQPVGIQFDMPQQIRSQVKKPQPIKNNAKNLQPIRSQVHSKSESPFVQPRPVKSLQSVKSQVAKPEGRPLGGIMPPPSIKTVTTNPTPTMAEQSVVKQETIPIPTTKPQSLYYCPISDCSFYTNKEGMKNSKAALHIKNDHKIKAKDMKPGMYKFTKIKV